jgi:hypothetical protein
MKLLWILNELFHEIVLTIEFLFDVNSIQYSMQKQKYENAPNKVETKVPNYSFYSWLICVSDNYSRCFIF